MHGVTDDNPDYVNGFASSLSADNPYGRFINTDHHIPERHFVRKTTERSSSFFRGLLS